MTRIPATAGIRVIHRIKSTYFSPQGFRRKTATAGMRNAAQIGKHTSIHRAEGLRERGVDPDLVPALFNDEHEAKHPFRLNSLHDQLK